MQMWKIIVVVTPCYFIGSGSMYGLNVTACLIISYLSGCNIKSEVQYRMIGYSCDVLVLSDWRWAVLPWLGNRKLNCCRDRFLFAIYFSGF